MATQQIEPGQERVVSGNRYTVLSDATVDGQPGLWWVCRTDDPAATPVLKDVAFLVAGQLSPPG